MLDTNGYRHTLRICNTYCFCTATMVMRTRLTCLYVHSSLFIYSFNKAVNCSQGAGIAQWLVNNTGQPEITNLLRVGFPGRWTFLCPPKPANGAQVSTRCIPRGVKPTIRLNLVTSLWISGALPPFPRLPLRCGHGQLQPVELYWEGCGMKAVCLVWSS